MCVCSFVFLLLFLNLGGAAELASAMKRAMNFLIMCSSDRIIKCLGKELRKMADLTQNPRGELIHKDVESSF